MNERIRFDEEQFLKLIRALNRLGDSLDKLKRTYTIHLHYKIEQKEGSEGEKP